MTIGLPFFFTDDTRQENIKDADKKAKLKLKSSVKSELPKFYRKILTKGRR